jgi:ankyrin repeat protein
MDYQDIYQGTDKHYDYCPLQFCQGFTLLMRLCWNGVREIPLQEIRDYLTLYPDEINRHNNSGWTALMITIYNRRTNKYELVKLLLEHGADFNHQTHSLSPLMIAVSCGFRTNYPIIKLLLEHGADPNFQTDYGKTILMIECICPNIKVVQILLEYGADTKIKDEYHQSIFKIFHGYYLDKNKYGSHTIQNGKSHKYKTIIKSLRKRNLRKLINQNQELKEKNKLLKQKLEKYSEGNHILELCEETLFDP